ncbi:transglutaminase-like enzyme [Lachnospiraceae bacterium KM106-2]|nr:transglutaminase-like enzyme [Lachnospiraceae bacterium KM106-2]
MRKEIYDYYSRPGKITNLEKYQSFINWLPDDPEVIGQVVQGLIVHDSWFGNYNIPYEQGHEYTQETAYMQDLLDKVLEIDSSDLSIPRHPKDRVIACCREFSTLFCAFLRAKGIPARSRCGFATYFGWDGGYEDHWICEYWNGMRWIRNDCQLDPFQQSTVMHWGLEANDDPDKVAQIKKFNPRDLKNGEFISAGEAWKLCRSGKEDPMKFGIGCDIRPEWGITSLHGLWFVRGQLLRDLGALNKVETVPYLVRICKGLSWNPWYLVSASDEEITKEEIQLLDKVAELTSHVDENFNEMQELYFTKKELTVPKEIIKR